MSQKILIINPPAEKGFNRSGRWPAKVEAGNLSEPLFLAYATAVLEKEGLNSELIDCWPFNMSQGELIKRFDENIILAVLQTSTASIDLDLETAQKIKSKFPGTKIALVGSHVSIFDKEILEKNKQIDFIARGEYDYTIKDLAKSLIEKTSPKNILGITFRDDQEIIRNENRPYIENLDELPWPSRHFLPMDIYFEPLFKSGKTFRLMASRGCPYRCSFCLWPQVMYGRKVRLRTPENVADEIEHLIKVYGAKGLYFEDDTITAIPQHIMGICNEIIRRGIKIPWSCLGRVNTVNKEMLEKMKKAGCYMIRYGVESSSQEILDKVKKGINISQVAEAFKMTQQIGIETHASYVFGLPGETKKTIEETIKFAIKLDSDYAQFAVAAPYPGTELYQEAKEQNWLKINNWSDFEVSEHCVLEYPNLKAEEIIKAVRSAYKRFYFRPGYIIKRALKVRSLAELFQLIKGAFSLTKKSISNT